MIPVEPQAESKPGTVSPAARSFPEMEDAIHALSQPLTALSMVLDLASYRSDAEGLREAIATARVECRRAVAAVQNIRAAAYPDAAADLRSVDAVEGGS